MAKSGVLILLPCITSHSKHSNSRDLTPTRLQRSQHLQCCRTAHEVCHLGHRSLSCVYRKRVGYYSGPAALTEAFSEALVRNRYGDYGALYKELLQDRDNNEEWHVWYPVDNHFPTAEDLAGFKVPQGCCCSVVTGCMTRCSYQKPQPCHICRASASQAASMMRMQRMNGI